MVLYTSQGLVYIVSYNILKGFQVTGQATEGEPDECILIHDRGRDPKVNAPGT